MGSTKPPLGRVRQAQGSLGKGKASRFLRPGWRKKLIEMKRAEEAREGEVGREEPSG